MWIKCNNKSARAILDKEISDEKIFLSDNGTANVPKDVGEALVEKYESFEAMDDMDDEEEELEEE